jgi:hypothetical protein
MVKFYTACIIVALSARRCLGDDFSDTRTVDLSAVRQMVIADARTEDVSAAACVFTREVQWWIDWNAVAVDRISMTVLMCVLTGAFALLLMLASLQVGYAPSVMHFLCSSPRPPPTRANTRRN